MHKYRLVAKKGEGTFSEVLKAQCIKNGKYVAIKCMKNHFDSLDQVNNLREIQALRRLSPHAHIIKLLEVLYDQPTGRLALVFELMDMNIYELIRGRRHYVAEDRVKNYMYQLMKAMDHMHRNGIFHRDIKPENILIMDDCLKLADFGSCRGIYSKQPYTEYISTRWYRAPECLLTDGYYNYKMDMWGVGCVFFEIMSLFPLFPGTNELDQIQKIHNILGTPPPELLAKMKKRSQHMDFNFPTKDGTGIAKLIPHVAPDCVDLICKLLAYNPDDRLSARQALRHPYFRELRDAEKRQKAMMNPEASMLSAQPSVASQLGIGIPASGGHSDDLLLMKSARHGNGGGSPQGSTGGAELHAQHSVSHLDRGSSPPGSNRLPDVPTSLPAIGSNKQLVAGQAYGHGAGVGAAQQFQLHGHTHAYGHGGGGAAGHAHGASLSSLVGQGQSLGLSAHHMTLQPHGGGGGGAPHDVGHGHGVAAAHRAAAAQQQHLLAPGDGGDEGPLEISNSAYRLHAESSMDTLSQLHSDGGLPPIGNLSLGKGVGTRRALPNYYDAPSHAAGGYGRGKAALGGGKARGVAAAQPKLYGGGGGPGSKGPGGMPAGVVGSSTVMGHKMAPTGVAGIGQEGPMSLGGGSSTMSFKFKSAAPKPMPKPYVSPYSLRQLGKDS